MKQAVNKVRSYEVTSKASAKRMRLYLENFIQKEILNKINILIKTSEKSKRKVCNKPKISNESL